jgi:hypothetical protein
MGQFVRGHGEMQQQREGQQHRPPRPTLAPGAS